MLTCEQEQAVLRRRGSLALTAGAGSGKTSVLVERFVRSVHEDGVTPGKILAITFTERAAGELRERIRTRLADLGRRDCAREAETAFIGTFHGFCARLLRAHPLPAGIDPGFRVMDEGIADRLRRGALREALAGFLEGEPPDAVDLVAAYGPGPLEAIVLDAYGALRSQGQSRPRLPAPSDGVGEHAEMDEHSADERADAAFALIDELLRRFGEAYAERKRRSSSLDFDDLELCARDLLRDHAAIRAAWAERFEMLMVDEFQDTNRRQIELLELLDRDNLFTVGDELQSIYGFRHAEVDLFRQRRERLSAEGGALALTHNFRSRPPILAAVDRVFRARLGERYTPLTAMRDVVGEGPEGELAGGPEGELAGGPAVDLAGGPEGRLTGGPAVELLLTDCKGWEPSPWDGLQGLPEATPWRAAEARLLAARVAELVDDGVARPGEVAILLRSLSDMPLYEAALRAAGLPTLAATGGFWGHRQVGDLLAYLRALANPLDELALYSTLACPLVGLSSDGLVVLARAARGRGCPAWQAIELHGEEVELALPPGDRERMRAFRAWFSAERRERALTPLPDLLRRAIEASGYDRHALSLAWGERRMANIHKLVRLARRYEAQEGRDLRGFLDHAAHLSDAFGGREADAPADGGQAEAVQLMSVHAAKGLEFPVVCVADLGRAPRLGAPDLIAERDGRLGLRLRVLGEEEASPVGDYQALSEELCAAQQAEEDRILYVAMTRARDRLVLSGAADLNRWPAPRQGGAPIAWLAPALAPDLPSLIAAGRDATCDLGEGLSLRCTINGPDAPRGLEPDQTPPSSPSLAELEEAWPTVQRVGGAAGSVERPSAMPVPLADPDATISYTSLAELERCGYRHYLERVLRLAENVDGARSHAGARDDLDPRARGTVVHLLLERVDFARPAAPTEGQVAEVARAAGIRLSPPQRAEIAALVERALSAPPAERLSRGGDVGKERPFAFSIGPDKPLVTGVLDFVMREPDGALLVVDYKSDRLESHDDPEEIVRREYGLQRLLYGLAAIEQGAGRVEVAHWFLDRPEEMVGVTFLASERSSLREQLSERLGELREEGFAVAQEPHRALCLTCPGRGGLCSWPESQTMRERPHAPARGGGLATLTP